MCWPALGAIVFWGFSFIATKVVLQELHPFAVLTIRFGMGALLLLLIQFRRDPGFLRAFSLRDWIQMGILAAIGIVAHTLLQAYALLFTTAIDTGWIIAIQPVFIAMAGRFFLEEAITVRKGIGMFLGFLGIFLIISKGVLSLSVLRFASTHGDLLVLTSALTWAVFTVGGRGFLCRFSPLAAIGPIMTIGFLILLGFTAAKGQWSTLAQLSAASWGSLLFLGIFCSGLAYLFWYSALRSKDSSTVGMYLYLEPLATLLGASLLLGEEVKVLTLAGGVLTLCGVYLTTWRSPAQNATKCQKILDIPSD